MDIRAQKIDGSKLDIFNIIIIIFLIEDKKKSLNFLKRLFYYLILNIVLKCFFLL